MRVLTLVITFVLASALGCTSEFPTTDVHDGAESDGAVQASNKWNNDNANPRINRGETHWASSWTDPQNNLRATHTTFPFNEPDCGLQELGEPIVWQDVGIFDPDDFFSSWIHETVTGEVWIIIRDQSQDGDCFGDLLVAEGWGTFQYNDNDIFAWYEGSERNNMNAYGFKGHGALTTPDGGTVMYNGHIRFTFDGDEANIIRSIKVNVH